MVPFLSASKGNVDRCARFKGTVTVDVMAEQRQIGICKFTERNREQRNGINAINSNETQSCFN